MARGIEDVAVASLERRLVSESKVHHDHIYKSRGVEFVYTKEIALLDFSPLEATAEGQLSTRANLHVKVTHIRSFAANAN